MLSASPGGTVVAAAADSGTASKFISPVARIAKFREARGQGLIARQSRSSRVVNDPGLPLVQGLLAVPDGAKGLVGWTVAARKSHRRHVPLGSVQQVCAPY